MVGLIKDTGWAKLSEAKCIFDCNSGWS